MILDLFRNGFSLELVINLCARVFVMFCILPIHEYAHALVATKLGDQTARLSGRLTINPLAHLDLIGSLMILLVGFGYAKPVPINMRNFKNRKGGTALTALAGPLSNLIMAFLSLIVYCAVFKFGDMSNNMISALMTFFAVVAQIDISLAVFNLIPIPPLDGSRIIGLVIPDKAYYKIMQYERYIVLGVLALMLLGAFDRPMAFVSGGISNLLLKLAALIFGIRVG